jgi:hypothetical protein
MCGGGGKSVSEMGWEVLEVALRHVRAGARGGASRPRRSLLPLTSLLPPSSLLLPLSHARAAVLLKVFFGRDCGHVTRKRPRRAATERFFRFGDAKV